METSEICLLSLENPCFVICGQRQNRTIYFLMGHVMDYFNMILTNYVDTDAEGSATSSTQK